MVDFRLGNVTKAKIAFHKDTIFIYVKHLFLISENPRQYNFCRIADYKSHFVVELCHPMISGS